MIFVTRNGKEKGPYTEEDVRKRLIANRLAVNDLARHEGDSELTPLAHLLNLPELLDAQPSPVLVKKPVLVWIIALVYILSYGLGVLMFVWLFLFMQPFTETIKYVRSRPASDFLSANHLASMIAFAVLNLAAGITLLRLSKSAYYLFLTAFVLDAATTIYAIVTIGWNSVMRHPTFIIADWSIEIAIVVYLKRLTSKSILR